MYGDGWNSEYYEILDFIYWEPQHLGKVKAAECRFKNGHEALSHVKDMEVSLNHILSIFFRLVPNDYVLGLQKVAFGNSFNDEYRLIGCFELRKYLPNDPTQPDLFMMSDTNCFSIELKTKSKTTVEQTVKYALLHRYHQFKLNRHLGSYLLYITPKSFNKAWKEKIDSIEELTQAINGFDFEAILKKTNLIEIVSPSELKEAALTTHVAHVSYKQLLQYSKEYHDSIDVNERYSSTVKNLVYGVISELELRSCLLGIGG